MRRTKEAAQATREAILDAAEEAFLELGVSHTSLSAIAKRAGVTRGAIYFHFPDKMEIYRAIIDRIIFPQEEMIREIEASQLINPLDILEQAACRRLTCFCQNPQQQRVVTILTQRCEYVGEYSEMMGRLRQAVERMIDLFTRMLTRADERGMLSKDWTPTEAARAIVSVFGGLIGEWLDSGRSFELERLGTRVIATQIAAFRSKAFSSQN